MMDFLTLLLSMWSVVTLQQTVAIEDRTLVLPGCFNGKKVREDGVRLHLWFSRRSRELRSLTHESLNMLLAAVVEDVRVRF